MLPTSHSYSFSQQSYSLDYRYSATKEQSNGENLEKTTVSLSEKHQYQSFSTQVSLSDSGAVKTSETYTEILETRRNLLLNNEVVASNSVDNKPASASAADNILGFIETGVNNAIARGATQEEAQLLLEQGLQGFDQGFHEALDQIESAGLLTNTINQSLETLYSDVTTGIKELGSYIDQQFAPQQSETPTPADDAASESLAPTPSTIPSSSTPTSTTPVATVQHQSVTVTETETRTITSQRQQSTNADSAPSYATQFAAIADYERKDSFSFTLETQEGDRVTISAFAEISATGSYYNGNENGEQQSLLALGSSYRDQLAFSVNGDLNEDEIAAIESLLGQVLDLADQFYKGDTEGAYQAALELGYDSNEIANYALSLRQVETQRIAAAYQSILPAEQQITPLNERLQPLTDFSAQLIDLLQQDQQPVDVRELLSQLTEQLDSLIDSSPTSHLHDMTNGVINHLDQANA